MLLDADQCYRAVKSRDPRFDGRFFTGVKTTGIYCRPICPARTPRQENMRYFSCAAAAEEAGFRACRRCRPETAPGTPEWVGPPATVSRALRIIAEGALDEGSVEDLAGALEVGPRHLSRLFGQHLGASPVAIAQTRRVQFARQLIDQTDLPMTEIAFSSGFSSIRRFNSAVKAAFDRSPSELRKKMRRGPGSGVIRLELPHRLPLDLTGMLEFLTPRAIPGVEKVEGGTYQRTVQVGGATGRIEVGPGSQPDRVRLEVTDLPARELLPVVERVRDLFDLTADPFSITSALEGDPRLRRLLKAHPGVRVPGAWDGFELAVRAILGQQVSVKGATTLSGRLVARFGEKVESPGEGLTHLFPTPDRLARARLSNIGMPTARGEAIRVLARATRDGALHLHPSASYEETKETLESLPGIGPWTAEYIAMRALRQPDAFPASDLGLRKALSRDGQPCTAAQLTRQAERWRPWRGYAAMLLWRSLGG